MVHISYNKEGNFYDEKSDPVICRVARRPLDGKLFVELPTEVTELTMGDSGPVFEENGVAFAEVLRDGIDATGVLYHLSPPTLKLEKEAKQIQEVEALQADDE